MADRDANRLVAIHLDDTLTGQLSPETAHERDVAIYALLEENSFSLAPDEATADTIPLEPIPEGPFRLNLSVSSNRLVMLVGDDAGQCSQTILLPLSPFRRVLRDYKIVCQSYFDAIKSSAPQRIEAIDMGRRGLHDEGSRLLIEALENKVVLDFETARRLFTLIYVLQWQGNPATTL